MKNALFRISHLVPVICIAIVLFYNCNKNPAEINAFDPLAYDSVRIALYIDDAVWPNCKTYTENILKKIGLPYRIVNADSVLNNRLLYYSVLIMPGGRPDLYEQNLGRDGLDIINNYVSRGGGYIGICGGAFLAAQNNIWRGWAGEPRICLRYNGQLGIFTGAADGPIEEFAPDYQDFNCGINIIEKDHFITSEINETIYYLYDHGPMFLLSDNSVDLALGNSVNGNKTLLLVTQYNNGRIFLSGGHPEVSSDPMCTILVEKAIIWCSKQDY
ncbi:MAG: hypothetical protein JXR46_05700 [Calditrichaceae bacterium]|nr:hypothetical protein [Calditrichaceae bacterium]MBN2708521.1 hypothetical protein [Calditrichaceae bacterium]